MNTQTASPTDVGWAQPPATSRTRSFVARHPIVVLMLIFNIFGQAFVLGPTVILGDRAPNLEVLQSIGLVLFLLLPALLLTRLSQGSDGLRALLRAMTRFRVHPAWLVLPLVAVPVGELLVNLSLPRSTTWSPGTIAAAYVTGFLPALLIQFVTTNWWEETVWAGVVQAPLQERYGPLLGLLLATPWFALEHVFFTVGGTLADGLRFMAMLTVAVFFVRACFGWIYQRTGSLALTGLVHASSNAAVAGLAGRLYHGSADGIVILAVLGLVALVATRGRLGWPARHAPNLTATQGERHA